VELLGAQHASIARTVAYADNALTLSADPNRGGLSHRLVGYLRSCGARRLIYVSCNVATQARDMQLLCAAAPRELQDERASGRCGTCHSSAIAHLQRES